uniref:Uncharacterized protein n=1 Tax=Rhizophora mucronata TaxID=61149 RepID=A0A2P2QI06_RHIMU
MHQSKENTPVHPTKLQTPVHCLPLT